MRFSEKGDFEPGSIGDRMATIVWLKERSLDLRKTQAIVFAFIDKKLAIKALEQCSTISIPGLKIKTEEEEMADLKKASEEFCEKELSVIALDDDIDEGILNG